MKIATEKPTSTTASRPGRSSQPLFGKAQVSQGYELAGASIMNIVQHCCIAALEEQPGTISFDNLRSGIEKELVKEGRVV